MNYNHIAPYYELLSRVIFGKTLVKSQSYFIGNIPPSACILIIGGGTGTFLPELLNNKNCKKILYLESSPEMIRLCKQSIAHINYSSQIEFRLGTEDNLLPGERFNTIITYCFLDLFNEKELGYLMEKLNKVLSEEGFWLVVDFRINHQIFHKIWQQLLIKILYLFFRITTGMTNSKLPPLEKCFLKLRFKCVAIKYFYKGMIFSAIYKKSII